MIKRNSSSNVKQHKYCTELANIEDEIELTYNVIGDLLLLDGGDY